MRILHAVEFYWPSVGGTQEVVRQISKRLVASGHDVTVATSAHPQRPAGPVDGVKVAEFDVQGSTVRGMTGEVDRYRQFLLESDFDVVTNMGCEHWTTDVMLPMLQRVKARKVFVPTGFANLYHESYRDYYTAMPEWMKQYDMNVFLSGCYRDTEFARRHGVEKRVVIPNGAAADEFSRQVPPGGEGSVRRGLDIPDGHFLILHVGSHTRQKGHAEAIEMFARTALQDATLLIVASTVSRRCALRCALSQRLFNAAPGRTRDGKKLIIIALTRAETVAAYHEADLFLFPSNIECSPIVLFECMASRTPFLTTNVGNAAEIIRWSGGGELLPTRIDELGYSHAEIEPSVRLLEELYRDGPRRQALADAGFRSWQQRFTWEHIAAQYESLYRSLLAA